MQPQASRSGTSGPPGTDEGTVDAPGGWLLVLCACLALWQPFNLALAAMRAMSALPLRGWPLLVLLAVRLIVTGLGLAAAIAILGRHAGAVRLTHIALTAWTIVELFVRTTAYFPNNRVPGDAPIYVAAILLYYAAWTAYLKRSRRVRRTFG